MNTIISFIAINNSQYSHTDWYIHTIVQISELATWQKMLIYSSAGLLVRHRQMSSLLVVVKSHLFPQLVHLNRKIGMVTAVSCSGHWGERQGCGCQSWVGGHVTREVGGGGGSQSWWAGNPLEARQQQLLTTLTHNRYLVETPG